MIGGVNVATSSIANIYNQGNNQLSDTLAKIASGKKFQNAGEDLISYSRANNLTNQIKGYNEVEQKLTDAKTVTKAAVEVSSKVYENLTKMSEIAEKFDAALTAGNTQEQAEYAAEFKSLRDTVITALDNAKVDGNSINTYKQNVTMDPNGSTLALDLTTNEVDRSAIVGLTLTDAGSVTTATTALDTETTNALNFMSQAKGFNDMIDNQISLNKTIVNSKEAVRSLITDIDEASEMSKMLDQNVRQQAAMSMLSQANMSRQVVMKLY